MCQHLRSTGYHAARILRVDVSFPVISGRGGLVI